MAITQGLSNSFTSDVLQGVHSPGDVYKIALYTSSATIGPSTTVYTSVGEVTGIGYTAGGVVLSGYTVSVDGTTAILDWTTDPTWSNASLTARGAMVYNSTEGNKAMIVMDFGENVTSTNGTFLVRLPVPDATTGLIRLS